jgi:hypothetical protein
MRIRVVWSALLSAAVLGAASPGIADETRSILRCSSKSGEIRQVQAEEAEEGEAPPRPLPPTPMAIEELPAEDVPAVTEGVVEGAVEGTAVESYDAMMPYAQYPSNNQWHAGYKHNLYGVPLALVVPPNAQYQTNYGWGVGSTHTGPIWAQYGGPMMGYEFEGGEQYNETPYWPWDTRQFGVYMVRGPWDSNVQFAAPDGFDEYGNPFWNGRTKYLKGKYPPPWVNW